MERANYSGKSDGHKLSLYAAMQSLYEKDKMFALQYIAAEDESTITYQSPVDEERRSQAAMRRKKQKDVSDKKKHIMDPLTNISILKIATDFEEIQQRNKRRKMDKDCDEGNEGTKTPPSNQQEVEVLYADGMWYHARMAIIL